jgi:hypothetical protein
MLPNNPLTQYFRQPAIYIRLPSQGKFYPPSALNMPPNGELPILPMTSNDEITYRTPDALFNRSEGIHGISCSHGLYPDGMAPDTQRISKKKVPDFYFAGFQPFIGGN